MTSTITLAAAEKAIEAGKEKAAQLGVESGFRDRVALVGGAVPLTDSEGRIIGAIGVGGGTPDQDHEVAEAVRQAF